MVDMLGLIITSGKVFAAVAAIATGLTVLARFLWSIHKFTVRLEKVIGTNGGKTLFERIDDLENAVKDIRRAIKAQDAEAARQARTSEGLA